MSKTKYTEDDPSWTTWAQPEIAGLPRMKSGDVKKTQRQYQHQTHEVVPLKTGARPVAYIPTKKSGVFFVYNIKDFLSDSEIEARQTAIHDNRIKQDHARPANRELRDYLTRRKITFAKGITKGEALALLEAKPYVPPAWRAEPTTDKQRDALRRFEVDPAKIPTTKGEASDLLGHYVRLTRTEHKHDKMLDEAAEIGGLHESVIEDMIEEELYEEFGIEPQRRTILETQR